MKIKKAIYNYLVKIYNLFDEHDDEPVILAEDFNIGVKHTLFSEMCEMLKDLDLQSQDCKYLNSSSNTFKSSGSNAKSLIDHCFATKGLVSDSHSRAV